MPLSPVCFLTRSTIRLHAIISHKQWRSLTPPHASKARQILGSGFRGREGGCCWGKGQPRAASLILCDL